MFTHRLTRTVAVTLALGAIAVPTATAMPIDPPTQDLRGADAQGAPTANDAYEGRGIYYPTPAEERQDLRHADTRDFAEGRGAHNSPDVVVVEGPAEPVTVGGVDWEDVGIGAGGMLSLALIGAGGALVVARRRSVRLAG
jgi:hypothetical protein